MDEETLTCWLDSALLMLGGFILITLLMLSQMNPPVVDETGHRQQGNIIVEMFWADQSDADVDLWVLAPDDRSVGYSTREGKIFNLLRDDLGHVQDITNFNSEIAYSRGIAAGEYIVNVHLYRVATTSLPMDVKVVLRIQRKDQARPAEIKAVTLQIQKEGQELTAFVFRLDSTGKLDGDITSIFKPVRNKS